MRAVSVIFVTGIWVGVLASAAAPAVPPASAKAAPTPSASADYPAATKTIQDLEALQKRNAAAPDKPIYEYNIEARVNADPQVAALRDAVAVSEAKLADAQDKYAAESPLLRQARNALDAVKKQLTETQRSARARLVRETLARVRQNAALAGKPGAQAYAVDDLVAADPRVAHVQAQMAPVEATYQQMKTTYVDGAPQLTVVKEKLDALKEKLNRAEEAARKDILANQKAPQGASGGVEAAPPSSAAQTGAATVAVAPVAASHEELVLDQPLTLDLHPAHLQAIVDQIGQSMGVTFVIDRRVVAPAGAAGAIKSKSKAAHAGTAKGASGYATNGMVGAVNVKGKPLREALRIILAPLGLSYSVQPGFIWISTPQHLRHETFEILETRQYALNPRMDVTEINANAGLPGAPLEGLDLMDVLRKAIPDVVSRENGDVVSRMVYDPGSHQLTVHTTPSNQKRIQALLEALHVNAPAKSAAN